MKNNYYQKNKSLLYCSLLACLAGIFLLPDIAYFSDITPEEIIELTNEARLSSGANAVTANQILAKAAYEKGGDIFRYQTFQHTIDGKKFSQWIKDAGYKYSYVGENLAIDFATSEGVVKAWLNSETHKENLLNHQFSEIGVAVLEDEFEGKPSVLVVQIFGRPLSGAAMARNEMPLIASAAKTLPAATYYKNIYNLRSENLLTASLSGPTARPSNGERLLLAAGKKSEQKNYTAVRTDKFIAQSEAVKILLPAIPAIVILFLSHLYFSFFFQIRSVLAAKRQ